MYTCWFRCGLFHLMYRPFLILSWKSVTPFLYLIPHLYSSYCIYTNKILLVNFGWWWSVELRSMFRSFKYYVFYVILILKLLSCRPFGNYIFLYKTNSIHIVYLHVFRLINKKHMWPVVYAFFICFCTVYCCAITGECISTKLIKVILSMYYTWIVCMPSAEITRYYRNTVVRPSFEKKVADKIK